jgi:hypothetical protein
MMRVVKWENPPLVATHFVRGSIRLRRKMKSFFPLVPKDASFSESFERSRGFIWVRGDHRLRRHCPSELSSPVAASVHDAFDRSAFDRAVFRTPHREVEIDSYLLGHRRNSLLEPVSTLRVDQGDSQRFIFRANLFASRDRSSYHRDAMRRP